MSKGYYFGSLKHGFYFTLEIILNSIQVVPL